jgi:hypothetical protein
VCCRATVADALTQAATTTRLTTPAVVLAAAAAHLTTRLVALRAPAPRLVMWRVAAMTTLLAATSLAVAIAMHDTERLFELTQSAYRTGQR